jgi:hypothetical protein
VPLILKNKDFFLGKNRFRFFAGDPMLVHILQGIPGIPLETYDLRPINHPKTVYCINIHLRVFVDISKPPAEPQRRRVESARCYRLPGPGSTKLSFHEVFMGIYYLNFYNWTGTTLWGGGTGADTDEVYLGTAVGGNYNLSQVRFYTGTSSDSFLGTGFDLGFDAGFAGNQIIPVPEPETWATGILLVLGGAVWLWKKRRIRI